MMQLGALGDGHQQHLSALAGILNSPHGADVILKLTKMRRTIDHYIGYSFMLQQILLEFAERGLIDASRFDYGASSETREALFAEFSGNDIDNLDLL